MGGDTSFSVLDPSLDLYVVKCKATLWLRPGPALTFTSSVITSSHLEDVKGAETFVTRRCSLISVLLPKKSSARSKAAFCSRTQEADGKDS